MNIPNRELRNEPVQKRSQGRLADIEDAARTVLERVGRDRFTTQQVAEAAGCSIGTLYRYFPDRVALLDWIWPDRDMDVRTIATSVKDLTIGHTATVSGVVRRISEVFDDGMEAPFVGGYEITVRTQDL